MNILIVKTSAIGDVIHTLPCLNALRHHYPDSHITWLVEEAAADVISGHPGLDRILISPRKRWIKQFQDGEKLKTVKEIYRFVKELRDTRYDLIIDFQNLLKSSIFIALAHGRKKVGYGKGMEHSEFSYFFLNQRIPAVDMNIHAVERELLLLKAIGVDYEEIIFDFPIDNIHRQEIDALLKKHGYLNNLPLVVINPMATWNTKLWGNDRFSLTADRLITAGNFVVFSGAGNDQSAIEDISAGMKNKAVNLAGQTSLKTLAALYEKADLVISTDTGPMHIAAAVETPVVAIFGSTAPWRTGPFGKGHQVLRAEIECSPCLKKQCTTMECMEQNSVDQVLKAVSKVINK